jgi:hypothetical protein
MSCTYISNIQQQQRQQAELTTPSYQGPIFAIKTSKDVHCQFSMKLLLLIVIGGAVASALIIPDK